MARDTFHNAVRTALEKEQWTITDDPLKFKTNAGRLEIDLGAEQSLLAAEQGNVKIAVEIKSFMSGSPLSEWHTALGQFIEKGESEHPQNPSCFSRGM